MLRIILSTIITTAIMKPVVIRSANELLAVQVAYVYINGKHVFKHLGGYFPFYIDISDEVKFGKNAVVKIPLIHSCLRIVINVINE